jgi:hypothetical protein
MLDRASSRGIFQETPSHLFRWQVPDGEELSAKFNIPPDKSATRHVALARSNFPTGLNGESPTVHLCGLEPGRGNSHCQLASYKDVKSPTNRIARLLNSTSLLVPPKSPQLTR